MTKKRATKGARKKTSPKAKKRTAARKPSPARKRTTASKARPASSVVVTLSDSHLPKIKAVASSLRARGMKVDSVLPALGLITGSYSKSPATLEKVGGVSKVEQQTPIRIPPPESDVQ